MPKATRPGEVENDCKAGRWTPEPPLHCLCSGGEGRYQGRALLGAGAQGRDTHTHTHPSGGTQTV